MTTYSFLVALVASRCRTDRGASLVEYALLVTLVAFACILGVTFFGSATGNKMSSVASTIR
jgi:pilus assembly protein Flp/PilA